MRIIYIIKNIKKYNILSHIYYFDKTEIKEINYSKKRKIQSEDGRLIENFIDEDREVISSLQGDIIYGDLLNYNLLIQKDFTILKKKMKIIQKIDWVLKNLIVIIKKTKII